MPKILENVRERVMEEAKRQVVENGYASMTIRSVAKACGLGVGTVYNYFPSKDMLIASFMLENWQQMLAEIRKEAEGTPEEVLRKAYTELKRFADTYRMLFTDSTALKVFAAASGEWHSQLIAQFASVLQPVCEKSGRTEEAFFSEFVAESLLTWTLAGTSFEELYGVLRFLFE